MPVFSITAERMADTWLGALAWAAGSQKWRGSSPALKAKPRVASTRIQTSWEPRAPGGSGDHAKLPSRCASRITEAVMARVPVCVQTR